MKLELTLPLPLSINKLYVNQYSWDPKTRTRVPTGRRVMSNEGEKVKAQIQKAAREQMKGQNWDYEYTRENFIYMDAYITMNRTDRDADNVFKLNNDSLEGIAYVNDSKVLVRTQKILYNPQDPKIELIFSPVEYRGVFSSQEHLDEFESNCKTCNRYKRNCSILRKAKEGRIQEEIGEDFICSKYKEIKT